MSSTSSQELAVSASDLNEQECEPSRSARSSHTPGEFLPSTGLESLATRMSERSPLIASDQTAFEWMSYAEDSLARISVSPAQAPGSLMGRVVAYGRSTPALLASFDRGTSSWRTSQRCLVEGLTVFSQTWPRSGLMRNGIAYQLPPLVPLMRGTASGLWQTPVADDKINRSAGKWNSRGEPKLSAQVKLWPTPTRVTRTGGAALCKWGGSRSRAKLRTMVTPEELNGALNPAWVEWLMGFPIGWTELERSVTQSSHKSRKSSDAQS